MELVGCDEPTVANPVRCRVIDMTKGPDEIGLARRLVVMLLGMMLMGNLDGDSIPQMVVGLIGLTILLAGLGVIELSMALWYQAMRRRQNAAHGEL